MSRTLCSAGTALVLVGAARAAALEVRPLSLSLATLDVPASAPADAPPAEESNYGITGNWWGARDTLQQNHVTVGGMAQMDVSKVLRGGLDTRAWPLAYLLDLHAMVDLDGALGLHGGALFACFQSHDQSQNGDAAVGDAQGFDNIYAPRYVQIAQLWYRQVWGDLRLKVGKIDANADACGAGESTGDCFSLLEHGVDFIQSAGAFSPTMFPMGTFPEPAPGAEIFLGKDLYAAAGAFYANRHQTFLNIAGHPEKTYFSDGGMFMIGEGGARWNWDAGNSLMGPGHAGIGGWYHNGDFPRVDGTGMNRGAGGGYAFIDQSIYHYEGKGETTRDTGFFFAAGTADRTTSLMDQNLIFGMSTSGWIPLRPADSMGVMASWVHLPSPGLEHPYEVATEAYYKIQLTNWASLKPSFAYIVSPGGMHPDAAVVTLRAEVDF